MLTQRAALDLLVQAQAPPDALAFVGHSAGGALGAILAAVEPRLRRIAISGNAAGPLARTNLAQQLSPTPHISDDVAAIAEWFDPAHFVGVQRQAQLLIQQGLNDLVAPTDAGRALFDAASQPKRWAEYPCDHALDADPQACEDRADFIGTLPDR